MKELSKKIGSNRNGPDICRRRCKPSKFELKQDLSPLTILTRFSAFRLFVRVTCLVIGMFAMLLIHTGYLVIMEIINYVIINIQNLIDVDKTHYLQSLYYVIFPEDSPCSLVIFLQNFELSDIITPHFPVRLKNPFNPELFNSILKSLLFQPSR